MKIFRNRETAQTNTSFQKLDEDTITFIPLHTAANRLSLSPPYTPPKSIYLIYPDIKQNVTLVERSVLAQESRFMTRALRGTASVRRRLNVDILSQAVGVHLKKDATAKSTLLAHLSKVSDSMEVDTSTSAADPAKDPTAPNGGNGGKTTPPIPEVEVYLAVLVVIYLHDQKEYEKGTALSHEYIQKVNTLNRRTLDQLGSRLYFYYARFFELTNKLADARPVLLAAQRTATLRQDHETQATLLNLLLRNYLHFNHYDQADKLVSKSYFPVESAPNNQLARYMYYLGRIKAIQLDYTESYRNLSQAIRKAPQTPASAGFQQAVHKLAIIVQLLMGEIPERGIFRQPMLRKSLVPYLGITKA
ncbi:26S proteasome non-ATPase regulatory subunit, partial [Quaeritorhiza haematococci]